LTPKPNIPIQPSQPGLLWRSRLFHYSMIHIVSTARRTGASWP
jgi:hypothetical protein